MVVVNVGQVVYSAASAPPVLHPEDKEPQAILRENGDRVAFLGERAGELLDGVVIQLAKVVEGHDALAVVKGGRCFLAEGKHSDVHRDRRIADGHVDDGFIVAVLVFFSLFITEKVVIVITLLGRRRRRRDAGPPCHCQAGPVVSKYLRWSSRVGCGQCSGQPGQVGSDKHKRYAYG